MTCTPWMSFYPADYLADTGHLTTQEHGAYLLLIFHYWQRGGLPTEDDRLAAIARLSQCDWFAIKQTIQELFQEGWRHKRIDAEIKKAAERHEKRAAAGRKGNDVRWHCDRNAIPTTTTTTEERKKELPRSAREASKGEFEEWWNLYPHKVGKGDAFKAWPTARRKASFEQITEGTRRYSAEKPDWQHWKHPGPWLRAEKWLDGISAAPSNVVPINGHYAEFGSPELDAWDEYYLKTKGRRCQRDKRGGWLVAQRWPPTEAHGANGRDDTHDNPAFAARHKSAPSGGS